MTGKIIKKTDKGFGFILEDGKPSDDRGVFFHSAGVVGTTFDSLNPNERVSFDIEVGADGRSQAVNVALLSGEAAPAGAAPAGVSADEAGAPEAVTA